MILCTAGYKNFSFYQFKDLVEDLDALIVDVRYVPYTPLPFWSIGTLQEKFGEKYIHIKELGNINYKDKTNIEIADFSTGLIRFVVASEGFKTCILLCGCIDVNKCHRKIVAEKIADQIEVERVEHL